MLKDRGLKKWNPMIMPEHVNSLAKSFVEENKIKKPELDEQTLEEFELIICEAMEFNSPLIFDIYENGLIRSLCGTVHYINHQFSQFILQDRKGYFHHISFNKIINIQPE